jgi:hypothetical protein
MGPMFSRMRTANPLIGLALSAVTGPHGAGFETRPYRRARAVPNHEGAAAIVQSELRINAAAPMLVSVCLDFGAKCEAFSRRL